MRTYQTPKQQMREIVKNRAKINEIETNKLYKNQ
jgi:hypothetical protein